MLKQIFEQTLAKVSEEESSQTPVVCCSRKPQKQKKQKHKGLKGKHSAKLTCAIKGPLGTL